MKDEEWKLAKIHWSTPGSEGASHKKRKAFLGGWEVNCCQIL